MKIYKIKENLNKKGSLIINIISFYYNSSPKILSIIVLTTSLNLSFLIN